MLVPSITFISRVHPLSKQEAAKLLFIQLGSLDFHQVRGHAERIVLKIPFALLASTKTNKKNPTYVRKTYISLHSIFKPVTSSFKAYYV